MRKIIHGFGTFVAIPRLSAAGLMVAESWVAPDSARIAFSLERWPLFGVRSSGDSPSIPVMADNILLPVYVKKRNYLPLSLAARPILPRQLWVRASARSSPSFG